MKIKRIISLVLAAALMLSMVYTGAVVSFADETDAGTYFYSSFEAGEEGQTQLPLLEDTIDVDAEGNPRSAGMGIPDKPLELDGKFTSKVTNVEGNAGFNAAEGLNSLIDDNASTKYLTNTAFPVNIIYTLSEADTLGAYSVVSANDAVDRDPFDWTIAGSNDKTNWTTLDTQKSQTFKDRLTTNVYEIDNETSYLYYRMQVTKRYNDGKGQASNMMQIADWNIARGIKKEETPQPKLFSYNSTGPMSVWNNISNKGWTGKNALKLESSQVEEDAYSYNVLYENVNVKITDKTKLSYMIFPDYVGTYDFEYTSHHMAVDLKFTDGTYLSDYGVLDQNGDVVSPEGQGEARALFTKQWNTISSKIGKVEALQGKIIDKILVGFEKHGKDAEGDIGILAYVDDIKIEEAEDKVYENQLAYTMVRRGTESSTTFSRGLNHPGVLYPNGFNFWSMCTSNSGSQLYKFQEGNNITHISTSHQASYWTGERGTVQFMVNTSIDAAAATSANTFSAGNRKSDYDRDALVDQANYLKINFKDGTPAAGATLELVPTDHAATVKFTFADDVANRNVIFDSVNTNTASFAFNEDGSFQGYTQHTSNGMKRMYFYGTFSVAPSVKNVVAGNRADAIVAFPAGTKEVVMNMATSFISADQAKHSLELEIGNKTFDQVYDETEAAWLEIMDKIEIEGASEEELITFWSSMYRLYMYPNNLSENLGTNEEPDWGYASPYRGSNDKPEVVKGYKFYYNNGFWDVYRTTPSAYALISPTLYSEFLNGFAQHYIDQGWVPRWVAPGGTNSMVGTSSDVMFADAYMRGIDFDHENAYLSALRNGSGYTTNATNGGRQQTQLSNYVGYVNASQGEGFSWSIEGYINDAGIAKMAEGLGDHDNAVYYANRALNYVKLFNPEVDFFMGRKADGSWTTSKANFNPKSWKQDGNFTETNGWNMAFSIVYDGQGLANLYGGKDALSDKLDQFFTEKGDYLPGGYGGDIHEMKEAREVKLGQYGHSNQPSHHIIYMYNYTNKPYNTQLYARDILDRVYVGSSIGQGFCGDADNGESSAWYIQAAMGLYAVNMGSGNFTFTSPLFDKVTIHLENGKDLVLKANNNSAENVYIQSLTVNGEAYNSTMISHEDLINAGEIVFEMGPNPSNWGVEEGARDSMTTGDDVAIPMDDVTTKNIVAELPAADSNADAAFVDVAVDNAANLFDNNGGNYVTINGNKASVYTYLANPTIVELYTISNHTSTTNVPDAVALYASNDGETWVELDSRTDVSFRWSRYVEPFAVNNNTAYKYYRIDLSSKTAETMNISEIELYAYVYKTITKDALQAKIDEAKALNQADYGTPFDALNAVVAQAEALMADENAIELDIYNIIQKIDEEIAALEEIMNPYEIIEAEDFSTAADGIVIDSNSSLPSGANVGGAKAGFWLKYNYVDFAQGGADYFVMRYARNGTQTGTNPHVDLYIDGRSEKDGGKLIGSLYPVKTATDGSWSNYTTTMAGLIDTSVTGIHDLYLNLVGDGAYVANIDYFYFETMPIVSVGGDISKVPNNRRTLEVTTTGDVDNILLYDANNNEIETSYVDSTTLENGNKLFEVDFVIDAEVGDVDIKVAAVKGDVKFEKAVTLTVAPFATSAVTDADEYVIGNATTFTVVADKDVMGIALANESGKFISKISETSVSNGDGTNTWTITAKFDTKGARTIKIFAAGPNFSYCDTGLSVDFNVDIAVSEGDAAVEVLSVRSQKSAAVNEVFTVTVKTSTSASKVGIFSETGSAMGKISQSYVDKNGERTWTITMKVGSKGTRTFDVKATDKTGEWSEAKSFEMEIYK